MVSNNSDEIKAFLNKNKGNYYTLVRDYEGMIIIEEKIKSLPLSDDEKDDIIFELRILNPKDREEIFRKIISGI
jgi:hypothetical protein